MAESIRLVDPEIVRPNPENPRLIFREDELLALQESIEEQGILVPLTVFHERRRFVLLDGERRWRCAIKIGLDRVPVIVQPKPDRLQNIMMMFAIHNARRDWDPLPTAYKLQELEDEYTARHGAPPTEVELAGLASITRGEVRRLRNLLSLPEKYRNQLLRELEKPLSEQVLTVDHVLEATRGAAALRKRSVIDGREEDQLRQAIVTKFRKGTIKNTVAPRQLARIARAVERGEVSQGTAHRVAVRVAGDPDYTIDDAFRDSVAQIDYAHGTEQLADRLLARLLEHEQRAFEPTDALASTLATLSKVIRRLIR